jgi:O-acetylserine/cysteine efflux transporter
VAFGVLLWGDVLTWKLVLGGVLTLTGIAVITVSAANRRAASPSP